MPKIGKSAGKNKKQEFAIISMGATLWQAAGKLRENMDAAEYKKVLLGLIFLQ